MFVIVVSNRVNLPKLLCKEAANERQWRIAGWAKGSKFVNLRRSSPLPKPPGDQYPSSAAALRGKGDFRAMRGNLPTQADLRVSLGIPLVLLVYIFSNVFVLFLFAAARQVAWRSFRLTGLAPPPMPFRIASLRRLLCWIPFGDHPLKLERYRED